MAIATSNENNNAKPAQATQIKKFEWPGPMQLAGTNSKSAIDRKIFANNYSNCAKSGKILLNINVSISNGFEPPQIIEKYLTIDLNKTLHENGNFTNVSREIINNYYLEALSKYKNCINNQNVVKSDKSSLLQIPHSFPQNQQFASRSVVQPYGYVMKKDDKYFVIPSDQVAFYNNYG